ncbi:MAG: CDP-alcohol phosphatidyltransferase family protein [Microcella sp.]
MRQKPAPDAATLRARDSRAATNALLGGLRRGGFSPRAIGAFLADATLRSVREARRRPRAVAEVTLVHAAVAALAGRRGAPWLLTSWAMGVTHLGMLEERTTLGPANILTVARAALPAAGHRLGSAVPVVALATDFADGQIARRTRTVTRFGAQGDFLADAALWTWFVLRYEHSKAWRMATFAAWLVPVTAVTAISIARGGMVDLPRSRWFRPAAAVEVLIGGRVIARWASARRQRRLSGPRKP